MDHDQDVEAPGKTQARLSAGTGRFYLWYTKTSPDAAPTPIGVYDHPPPPEAAAFIRSVQLADIGVIPLLERTTAAGNWLYNRVSHLLAGL